MRRHPHLFEANARIFLERLSRKHNSRLTLSTVPEEEWEKIRERGFDLIWLMGAWQRSPGAAQVALRHEALRRHFPEALPDLSDKDIEGSPYAVYSYMLDPALGRHEELLELKRRLNYLGMKLIVDFVPNHVALDHPWTLSHPEWFVRPKSEALGEHPDWFFKTRHGIDLAHGRDPYFPPWTDSAQLNYFSAELRQVMIQELGHISKLADGVRCDMAMLAMNAVFDRVWSPFAANAAPVQSEFWTQAIRRIKEENASFLFLAEAYWGLEWPLHELGFDYAYDKPFYDHLLSGDVAGIRTHLEAAPAFQEQCMRFIENHDEQRAVKAFGPKKSMAAAVMVATLPGLRFFHDGQAEGKKKRLPVQLVREPAEKPDVETMVFYRELWDCVNTPCFHQGQWASLEVMDPAFGGISKSILAWVWILGEEGRLVAVNYSEHPAKGRIELQRLAEGRTASGMSLQFSAGEAHADGGNFSGSAGVNMGAWSACIARIGVTVPQSVPSSEPSALSKPV